MDTAEITKLYVAANAIVAVMDKINLKGARYRELSKCYDTITSILIDEVGEIEMMDNVSPPNE